MIRKRVHTVFESDFPSIRILFNERSGDNFVKLYAGGTLEIREHRYLNLRTLISEERTLDLFIEERGRIAGEEIGIRTGGKQKTRGHETGYRYSFHGYRSMGINLGPRIPRGRKKPSRIGHGSKKVRSENADGPPFLIQTLYDADEIDV